MKKVDKDQFLEETNYKNVSDKSSKLNSEYSSNIKRKQEFDLSEFDFQCQNYITSKEESDLLKRFQHNQEYPKRKAYDKYIDKITLQQENTITSKDNEILALQKDIEHLNKRINELRNENNQNIMQVNNQLSINETNNSIIEENSITKLDNSNNLKNYSTLSDLNESNVDNSMNINKENSKNISKSSKNRKIKSDTKIKQNHTMLSTFQKNDRSIVLPNSDLYMLVKTSDLIDKCIETDDKHIIEQNLIKSYFQ